MTLSNVYFIKSNTTTDCRSSGVDCWTRVMHSTLRSMDKSSNRLHMVTPLKTSLSTWLKHTGLSLTKSFRHTFMKELRDTMIAPYLWLQNSSRSEQKPIMMKCLQMRTGWLKMQLRNNRLSSLPNSNKCKRRTRLYKTSSKMLPRCLAMMIRKDLRKMPNSPTNLTYWLGKWWSLDQTRQLPR